MKLALHSVFAFATSYAIVKEQYQPERLRLRAKLVEVNGFEPMASCVQGRRSPS